MTTRITTENITDATIGTADLASSVPLNTQWQAVVTASTLNAVAGRGYFINTTSNTCTVTLPGSPSVGDVVVLKDYARTWGTNAVTIASVLSDGSTTSLTFSTEGQTVTLVYMDGTKGWSIINEDTTSDLSTAYISATGGTVTTSGNFKIHSFTGDGCFVVSQEGIGDGPSVIDYLVVAGGAGGGGNDGGGGGAGGYRESHSTPVSGCYTASPLATATGLTVTATTYPVTVGGGGTAGSSNTDGGNGANSIFSTITSTGGGGGAAESGAATCGPVTRKGEDGGSGGGSGQGGGGVGAGGSGNTPPVSPPQGQPGGAGVGSHPISPGNRAGGAGGGAGGNGGQPNGSGTAGGGGSGTTSSINATPTARAGGGGGGGRTSGGGGGPGGGGAGSNTSTTAGAGTANTGGGGGGAGEGGPVAPRTGAGGSGIVIIRYKFQ